MANAPHASPLQHGPRLSLPRPDRTRPLTVAAAQTRVAFLSLSQILVGVLRHYVTQLLDGPPKKQPKKAVREQSVQPFVLFSDVAPITHAQRLRTRSWSLQHIEHAPLGESLSTRRVSLKQSL